MATNSRLWTALALAGVVGSGIVHAGSVGTIVLNGNERFSLNYLTVKTDSEGKLEVRVSYGDGNNTEPEDGNNTEPDTDLGNCGPRAGNVDETTLPSTSKVRYDLLDKTMAFPFTTSREGNRSGQFETVYTTTNPRTRSTWISKCAGGAPLTQTQLFTGAKLCESIGREATNVTWSEQGAWGACTLEASTRYYFNVRNADSWDASRSNCDANNCPFIFQSSGS